MDHFGLMSCTDQTYLRRHLQLATDQVAVLSQHISDLVLRHDIAANSLLAIDADRREVGRLDNRESGDELHYPTAYRLNRYMSKSFRYSYRLRLIVAEGTRTRFHEYASVCSLRLQQLRIS